MNRVERALAQSPAGSDRATRAARLAQFTSKRDQSDRQTVEHWRSAPARAHADATCALSDYAHRTVQATGLRALPAPVPPLSRLRRDR